MYFLAELGHAYLNRGRHFEAHNLTRRALSGTPGRHPRRAERVARLEAASLGLPRQPGIPESPNLLFIVIQGLRPDHLGTHGYRRKTTPRIDAIADGGVVFENATTTANWTAAAMADLFLSLIHI